MTDYSRYMVELSEEHQDAIKYLREFLAKEVRPHAAHYDQTQETPWPIIEKAREAGYYTAEFLGEMASNPVFAACCVEEFFRADAGIALAILGTGLAATAIFAGGTPEQWFRWLPGCFEKDGKAAVAAFCLTEPEAGSDVANISTTAKLVDGEWVLNGSKTFITNGGIANVYVVIATVDRSLNARGHASFIVPAGTPGLSHGKKFTKVGIRASNTTEVFLDDVRIPADHLLGDKDALDARIEKARTNQASGGSSAMKTLERTRILVAAQAVGVAQAAYELAVDYAEKRKQFGQPLIENQAILFTLADMKVKIDAARMLVLRAATMAKDNVPFAEAEGSQAKLYAGEIVLQVTEEASKIFGGSGFMDDTDIARLRRDAGIFSVYEGAGNIQKIVIGRAIRTEYARVNRKR